MRELVPKNAPVLVCLYWTIYIKIHMKHEITKQRLQELAAINNPFLRNEAMETPMAAASEMLSLLAHPDMKRSMDALSDMIDDQQFMAIKKLYDGLYMELKKHE